MGARLRARVGVVLLARGLGLHASAAALLELLARAARLGHPAPTASAAAAASPTTAPAATEHVATARTTAARAEAVRQGQVDAPCSFTKKAIFGGQTIDRRTQAGENIQPSDLYHHSYGPPESLRCN